MGWKRQEKQRSEPQSPGGLKAEVRASKPRRTARTAGMMERWKNQKSEIRAAEGRQETERRQADAEQQIGRTKTESLSSHDMRGPDLIRRKFLALLS